VSFGLDHPACAPCVPPTVQTVQIGPIGRGSQMMQIEVGSGNRCVSHPCLYGHRINYAGQPEASRTCAVHRVCAVRRCGWRGAEKPSPLILSQQGGEAGESVNGFTVAGIEEYVGVPGFLDDLRAALKDGSFRPLPVRERKIPKQGGSGKVRSLGIPTVADRVVQAALKLVLEPIFEADFLPVCYGFRPRRRAYDAIAEIRHFGTRGYRWVLDADIEACFDPISHAALMDRVRARVKD
jgi:Reverse transcriptase (RNA-dependent DNA polymerase)